MNYLRRLQYERPLLFMVVLFGSLPEVRTSSGE